MTSLVNMFLPNFARPGAKTLGAAMGACILLSACGADTTGSDAIEAKSVDIITETPAATPEPQAPETLFVDMTVEGFEGWITQAKAELRGIDDETIGQAAFLPADGRLTRKIQFDQSIQAPVRIGFTANVILAGTSPRDVRVAVQTGCENAALEGRMESVVLQPGPNSIDQSIVALKTADCVMVRFWAGNEAFDVTMNDIVVTVQSQP